MSAVRVIQDPVYGAAIQLDGPAVEIVDTEPFQRARRIKQLGYAYLVYPSANHSRFEHMLGAYHVAGRIIDAMSARGEVTVADKDEALFARLSLLVHDAGHFNGAHILETAGVDWADHEVAGERWISDGPIADVMRRSGLEHGLDWIAKTIRHEGASPFSALVAGEIDGDRLDYMRRDAYYCFGAHQIGFNQDRLIDSLTIQVDPTSGERRLMLHEKGLNALEQMIWHRYNLYRNIYWHRKVRSASAMARAMILHAVEGEVATTQEIMSWHDEQMFHILQERVACVVGEIPRKIRALASRLVHRDLYSVATQLPVDAVDPMPPAIHRAVEKEIATHLGLDEGEALLDIPNKPGMFELDMQVMRKDGSVVHLRDLESEDGFVMNGMGDTLYRGAGRVTLFTAEPQSLPADELMRIVETTAAAGSGAR